MQTREEKIEETEKGQKGEKSFLLLKPCYYSQVTSDSWPNASWVYIPKTSFNIFRFIGR